MISKLFWVLIVLFLSQINNNLRFEPWVVWGYQLKLICIGGDDDDDGKGHKDAGGV